MIMDVIFYATLRQIVGARTVEIDAPEIFTVRELLAEIIRRYPALAREMFDEDGNLYSHVRVIINGRDLSFVDDNLEARISSADTISIFPAVGGG
jgi:molybdopterin synthase sulfur carrier subunit